MFLQCKIGILESSWSIAFFECHSSEILAHACTTSHPWYYRIDLYLIQMQMSHACLSALTVTLDTLSSKLEPQALISVVWVSDMCLGNKNPSRSGSAMREETATSISKEMKVVASELELCMNMWQGKQESNQLFKMIDPVDHWHASLISCHGHQRWSLQQNLLLVSTQFCADAYFGSSYVTGDSKRNQQNRASRACLVSSKYQKAKQLCCSVTHLLSTGREFLRHHSLQQLTSPLCWYPYQSVSSILLGFNDLLW